MGDILRVEISKLSATKWKWICRSPGQTLVSFSPQPLLDACRAVKSMGAPPWQEIALFREGRSEWDLKTTVGYGAGRTVKETEKGGPRFTKWAPFMWQQG